MYVIFDTETTGKAISFSAPITDFKNWPRIVQIAWKVFDYDGIEVDSQSFIIKPTGFIIPDEVIAIHRITNERAKSEGVPIKDVLSKLGDVVINNKYLIAHNIAFDSNVVGCELLREGMHNYISEINHIDTMKLTTDYVGIPNKRRGGFKFPSQTELHKKLFNKEFDDAHDALADVTALSRCFFKLQEIGILGFKEEVYKESIEDSISGIIEGVGSGVGSNIVPLGLHTFYSILEGAGSIDDYIKLAEENGHPAISITDNSTLSGAFELFQKCKNKDIKPIIGVEMFLNDNIGKFGEDKEFEGDNYKIKIFVKNEQGYKNLNHLIYIANTDGYFKKIGRIKTEWLLKYKDGLIVSTSGLDGKLANMVLRGKNVDAERYINMLNSEFGDNLFIELQFSRFSRQKQYNNFLIRMMRKYDIMSVLSNNTYYPKREDSLLQDVVTSISQHRPMQYCSLKEDREAWYFNCDDYKNMNKVHGFNYPESFLELCMNNTIKFANKCSFELEFGVEKFPKYEPTQDVVEYFKTEKTSEIIVKLAFAKLKQKINKYKENKVVNITDEKIKEYVDRLNYEISVIESKKMLDYFMVNWEIINYYRNQGNDEFPNFDIGPARGCFKSGSKVKMADGCYTPIEDINIGDRVIDAFGYERSVIDTLNYDIDEDIIEIWFGEIVIECTLDHKILTRNRGWVQAKDLTKKDNVADVGKFSVDGNSIAKLTKRKIKKHKGVVYDLTVEETHSYNIEGLGVHNSAAGSLLSWCLDITKIDPIRFDLYFERFLNPERNCLTSKCSVILKDGTYKNIVDIEVGDPVKTEHGLGVLVQKHERELKDNEDVFEIETEDGAVVQLTGCHIVPVFRDGERIEVRVDKILETDELFVS